MYSMKFEGHYQMMQVTLAQLIQLGKKCSLCEEKAKWLDKYDENAPAYCDKHFPGRICECEICKKEDE